MPNRVAKGKRFERKVARLLRDLDPRAGRCLQYQREHGAPDVRAWRLWVECKSYRVPPSAVYAVKRAMLRAGCSYLAPALVQSGGKGRPLLVTMELTELVRLLAPFISPAENARARKGER